MSSWHDEFQSVDVEVATANEQVFVTVRGDSDVRVRLAPGYYERASTSELATSLSRAAQLAVVRRTRVFYAGLSRQVGHPVAPGTDRDHPDARLYRERLDGILAVGEALGGRMRLTCQGLLNFQAYIEPGLTGSVDEGIFTEACGEGALALIADQRRQVATLKFDVYFRPELERRGLLTPT